MPSPIFVRWRDAGGTVIDQLLAFNEDRARGLVIDG